MSTLVTRHLHIEIPPDLCERIGTIAGRTGVTRLAWIIAALTAARQQISDANTQINQSTCS
jgi:hypothetical protein